MKNNKVWYIGYLISVVSLIISFAGNHRKSAFIALVIFAAVTFCVTHIMVVHNKMLLKNEEYKIPAIFMIFIIFLIPIIMLVLGMIYEKKF